MYGTASEVGYASATQIARPVPELGRIKAAVERIAKARSDLECFLGRFNGNATCVGGGACAPETDSYRNDIAALFEQIDYLEKVVELTRDIG